MSMVTTIDNWFDRRSDRWWRGLLVLDIVRYSVLIPVFVLLTVVFGTEQVGETGWTLNLSWLLLSAVLALPIVALGRYLVRLRREWFDHYRRAIVIGGVVATLTVMLALPGLPLAEYWKIPGLGLVPLLVCVPALYVSFYLSLYAERREKIKKTFS